MNVLALETSMGACSAAVLRGDGTARALFARLELMERGHAEALMPMVAQVMVDAALEFADLDVIAATTGPGSFTGVRIAIAAARGLVLVTKASLFGTDSLTVLARAAWESGIATDMPLAVAVDARRGMVYFGLYDAKGHRLEGPLLIPSDKAAGMLPSELRCVVGSAADLLAAAAQTRGRTIDVALSDLQPSAAALAEIACESGETTAILRPLYLRPPDAKPQVQQVARR